MKRILISGFALAVLAALAVFIGSALNMSLGSTLFAGAVGAVLGLEEDKSPLWRIGAFLIGFVIAWIMYGVQALLLPQIPVSAAIGTFVTLAIITVVAALAKGKLPFWACLLGAAAISGAYAVQFNIAPQNFQSESAAAAGSTLFCAALGLIAASLIELFPATPDEPPITARTDVQPPADLDILSQSSKG